MKWLLGLIVAAAAGYAGWWYLGAGELREVIERNVAHVSAQLEANHPDTLFTHEGIGIAGFPGTTSVVISHPVLTVSAGGMTYKLETPELPMQTVLSGEAEEFYIKAPETMTATVTDAAGKEILYNLRLDKPPALFVRQQDEDESGGLFDDYALKFPTTVGLQIKSPQAGDDFHAYKFNPLAPKDWKPLHYDVAPLVTRFFSVFHQPSNAHE